MKSRSKQPGLDGNPQTDLTISIIKDIKMLYFDVVGNVTRNNCPRKEEIFNDTVFF